VHTACCWNFPVPVSLFAFNHCGMYRAREHVILMTAVKKLLTHSLTDDGQHSKAAAEK